MYDDVPSVGEGQTSSDQLDWGQYVVYTRKQVPSLKDDNQWLDSKCIACFFFVDLRIVSSFSMLLPVLHIKPLPLNPKF